MVTEQCKYIPGNAYTRYTGCLPEPVIWRVFQPMPIFCNICIYVRMHYEEGYVIRENVDFGGTLIRCDYLHEEEASIVSAQVL